MSNDQVRERNVHIVHTVLDNARAGRLKEAEPFFADDFTLHVAEGLPYGRLYRGWQGYTEALRELKQFWSETKHVSREFIPIDDSRVMVHFMLDGRIARNGRHVEMPIVAIWELEGGRIVRIRPFYFDTKRIADLASA